MESPLLSWLAGWLLGLLSDCLQAWCRQLILRRLGLDGERRVPTARLDDPPSDRNPPSGREPLLDRLYQTVARYRQEDCP